MSANDTSKENSRTDHQDSEQALLLFKSLSEKDRKEILRIMREKQISTEIQKRK